MYQVLDNQNRVKLQSTETICRAWVKHHRAEFFCRVIPVVEAVQMHMPAMFSVMAY